MHAIRVGETALLVECDDLDEVLAVHAEALRRRVPARDVVPAAATVLFDGVADPAALADELDRWDLAAPDVEAAPLVELPTTYDGADLTRVADLWKMDPDEVVSTHQATEFVVAFCGFSPGFAYCTGLSDRFEVPRLAEPRTRVPAGSVALADRFTGVYPRESPGGWLLIGRTEAELWNPRRDPSALLAPGTRVRFVDA